MDVARSTHEDDDYRYDNQHTATIDHVLRQTEIEHVSIGLSIELISELIIELIIDLIIEGVADTCDDRLN